MTTSISNQDNHKVVSLKAALAAGFLSFTLLMVSPAGAYGDWYKTTSTQMAATTSYGIGPINTTFNQIGQCQNPTFSAKIYLKTSGGSTVRSKTGNCGLYLLAYS